jgi:type 1 glutamine amidotransferase
MHNLRPPPRNIACFRRGKRLSARVCVACHGDDRKAWQANWTLGHDDTHHTEVLAKKELEFNAKCLNDFDAVFCFTGGNLEMDTQQKADLLSFVHDDGKGFVGVHSAAITWTSWPEYVDMVGGTYDEHPWGTFNAPIIVKDPGFPGMHQWPWSFVLHDEVYQLKDFSIGNRHSTHHL